MEDRRVQPLDDRQMFFLSTFLADEAHVRSYSIDVEKAQDSHYQFTPEAMSAFDEHLCTTYSGTTLSERLAQFIATFRSTRAAEDGLLRLVDELGLEVQQFHFY